MLKTTNERIAALVNYIVLLTNERFKDRCTSIYAMGSLARGGFSELSSDIDIGIILDGPIKSEDNEQINKIQFDVMEKHSEVSNEVSIFWGSISSINGVTDEGRYPLFDRVDLLDHGLLLSGKDIRTQLKNPSKKELDISSALFALEYLETEEMANDFSNSQSIIDKGPVYTSKIVLYPCRFIYLQRTGEIAGNDVSYQYYIKYFKGRDSELVEHAYQWRHHSFPESIDQVVYLLDKGLLKLYLNFLDIYIQCLTEYGEIALKQRLVKWKRNLTRTLEK